VPVAEADIKNLPVDSQGKFTVKAFVSDAKENQMHCPAGKAMPKAYFLKLRFSGRQKVKVGWHDQSSKGWAREVPIRVTKSSKLRRCPARTQGMPLNPFLHIPHPLIEIAQLQNPAKPCLF